MENFLIVPVFCPTGDEKYVKKLIVQCMKSLTQDHIKRANLMNKRGMLKIQI